MGVASSAGPGNLHPRLRNRVISNGNFKKKKIFYTIVDGILRYGGQKHGLTTEVQSVLDVEVALNGLVVAVYSENRKG